MQTQPLSGGPGLGWGRRTFFVPKGTGLGGIHDIGQAKRNRVRWARESCESVRRGSQLRTGSTARPDSPGPKSSALLDPPASTTTSYNYSLPVHAQALAPSRPTRAARGNGCRSPWQMGRRTGHTVYIPRSGAGRQANTVTAHPRRAHTLDSVRVSALAAEFPEAQPWPRRACLMGVMASHRDCSDLSKEWRCNCTPSVRRAMCLRLRRSVAIDDGTVVSASKLRVAVS
ncbi:hypothetical protein BDW02DRAFT_581993 [Decorospora gaudefroyi]|uniref:Uncharacterized protein n=1 Tax=Decorospora gaudefroyi TaxID=184978 RepID=A0A6A5K962_9PLEO|nr:hypothetical protein BDW02DRAFT_581993 [Decorospora gaudefroyi]